VGLDPRKTSPAGYERRQCGTQLPTYVSAAIPTAPASGRIRFVPAATRQSGVTTASDRLIVSTNLKRDFGNTERSLRDAVQLEGVKQVLYERTDLSECSPEFNYLLHALLC